MRKYIYSALILVVFTIFIFFQPKKTSQSSFSEYQVINFQLENKNLRLLVADSQQKRERGLMDTKKLEPGIAGMIFVFPRKDFQSFWNKNTLMNLDLYWLAEDKIIGKDFLPAIKENGETIMIGSPQPVDKVIEIPR